MMKSFCFPSYYLDCKSAFRKIEFIGPVPFDLIRICIRCNNRISRATIYQATERNQISSHIY